MTPSNSIFRGVYKLSKSIEENTTDFIDGTDEGLGDLPLVYVGEGSIKGGSVKDLVGNVSQTIHVYGKREQRMEVDTISAKIVNGLKRGIEEYNYRLVNPKIETLVLDDVSMGQKLIHYVIEYSVVYSKK